MMRSSNSRYSRQTRFAPWGEQGQGKLASSSVVIVGCGALGTVQAEILTRAGVGRLRIIDRDIVELSNLQRQFLFSEADAADGIPKAMAAARRLAAINSEVAVEPHVADLSPSNIAELFEEVDLILDATDNFETRYLVNDFSVREGIPWIYGAAVSSYGLKMAVIPGATACFKCVYPEPPKGAQETCETAGVLASVTAAIASLQCADAMKILAGAEFAAKLTTLDVWSGEVRQAGPMSRDPECPCCGARHFIHLEGSRRAPVSLCGRNAVQIHERARPLDLAELSARLAKLAPVRANEFALRVVLDAYELMIFPDGRAIIKGTTDVGIARSLYARYVGA
ncbi:MAG TPA: ThiF family adenylyltransferase [Bryobacteraceae bacterium]|nr:ThiF family adenylyltransferase [Bryobacteraceae bacterium]